MTETLLTVKGAKLTEDSARTSLWWDNEMVLHEEKSAPRSKMSEVKAVIKNADMPEDMQQDVAHINMGCATMALEKFNIEKDIAAYIKRVREEVQPPPGTASSAGTSEATSHMRPSISSISTWDNPPSCCSVGNV